MRRLCVLVAGSAVYLVAAPAAFGQDPTQQGYGGAGGQVQGGVSGSGGGGALPFTGLDLLFLVAAALLLVGAGLMLRRVGRVRG